jgi:hypothetical protein
MIGVLPANGTKCTTDHSGENNPVFVGFVSEEESSSSSGVNTKAALGLGLGLGFPILIAIIVFLGYWFIIRRKQRKPFVARPKYIPRDDPPLPSEETMPERPPSIVIGDWKDRSLFPE